MKQLHENKLIVTCTLTNSAKTYVLKVLIKLCALRIRSVPNRLGNFYWAVIATVRLAAVFKQHHINRHCSSLCRLLMMGILYTHLSCLSTLSLRTGAAISFHTIFVPHIHHSGYLVSASKHQQRPSDYLHVKGVKACKHYDKICFIGNII